MTDGILYVAIGKEYEDFVQRARNQLWKVWSWIPHAIYRTEPEDNNLVMLKKIEALRDSPFDKTLYLDVDTYIIESCTELFEVLDRFDIAMALAPWRIRFPADAPECFPEFNGGVMAIRKSDAMAEMFEDWERRFLEQAETREPGEGTGYFPSQPSLREALYYSNLRIATLPAEYNWRGNGYVQCKVKIIHGRGIDFAKEAREINHYIGPRVKMKGVLTEWR